MYYVASAASTIKPVTTVTHKNRMYDWARLGRVLPIDDSKLPIIFYWHVGYK